MDWFLKNINIESFGSFSRYTFGPLKPGFNLIYGENESGKSTINKCLEGILFGWEAERGNKNTYKPLSGVRAASVDFQNEKTLDSLRLSRDKNAEGLKGEKRAKALVSDIDKDTYLNLFGLTSEELQELKDSSDLVSKLLSAGAGTENSPQLVLEDIDKEIKTYLSKSKKEKRSLFFLREQYCEIERKIESALEENETFLEYEAELKDVEVKNKFLNKKLEESQQLITSLEYLKTFIATKQKQKAELQIDKEYLQSKKNEYQNQIDYIELNNPLDIDYFSEYSVIKIEKDIDRLKKNRETLINELNVSRENLVHAQINKETLQSNKPGNKNKTYQNNFPKVQFLIGIYVLVTLFAIISGFLNKYLLLSFFAILSLMISGYLTFFIKRKSKNQDFSIDGLTLAYEQATRHYQFCEQRLKENEAQIIQSLNNLGLQKAEGSLEVALSLLAEFNKNKVEWKLIKQQLISVEDEILEIDKKIGKIEKDIASNLDVLYGIKNETFLQEMYSSQEKRTFLIEAFLEQQESENKKILEEIHQSNQKIGKIRAVLKEAEHKNSFGKYKLEKAIINTKIEATKQELALLYMQKHILKDSINLWEKDSQPKVYLLASDFFKKMTNQEWQKVSLNAAGEIEVFDKNNISLSPVNLSLGTRQQLYLALKLSLLIVAQDTGKALPIMADDILVHFDNQRRRQAANLLLEIAKHRQIIFFTCHEEIAQLVFELNKNVNYIKL